MYFFCLVLLLVWNFDSIAKTPLQQRNLIRVLAPRAAFIYHINGLNFDKSIVTDIAYWWVWLVQNIFIQKGMIVVYEIKITKFAKKRQLSMFFWKLGLPYPV